MSIINEGIAACIKCGNRQNLSVYNSINVVENPDLKEKVMDGSLFLWECSECGTVNLTKYETLYHDPKNKLMVWLIYNDDISSTQMQAITNHAKAIGDYKLRTVNDLGGLMEKVLIHNAGLDDRVIELCKYVTKMEIASKLDESQTKDFWAAPFHFYKMNDGEAPFITFMYPDTTSLDGERRMIHANVGMNVYEDCLGIIERNPNIKNGEGFEKIDSQWLLSIMS